MIEQKLATPCSPALIEMENLALVLQKCKSLAPQVDTISDVLVKSLKSGKKLVTCGNGGRAADAMHFAEELMGRYRRKRKPLPAVALCTDPTLLTCIANDFGFDQIFSRQIEGIGEAEDVLILFSTSGNSPNLVAALEAATRKRMLTIALLGKDGGAIAGQADYEIVVPSQETSRIQEVHTFILHVCLERIDQTFSD
jgi:D-sedoheptulose 7-phosphate isomerase